jgi:hypothetical protein
VIKRGDYIILHINKELKALFIFYSNNHFLTRLGNRSEWNHGFSMGPAPHNNTHATLTFIQAWLVADDLHSIRARWKQM